MAEGNKPEKKFKAGAISATVWNNTVEKDRKKIEFKTVSIERSYKDSNGEWKTTNSMRSNDLPKVALVAQKAYDYIVCNEKEA